MKKYKVLNLDAGLLSGGFENYGQTVPVLRSLIDLFSNHDKYTSNPEEFIKNHPDFVFSGRITKVVTDRIIRPYVIVSDKLEFMDKKKLSDIIKYNIDLFAAYFLQAIKILANVYNVDLTMIARQVTDRTLTKTVTRAIKLSKGTEDITDKLVNKIVKEYVNVSAGIEADEDVDNGDDAIEEVVENNEEKPVVSTEVTFKDAEKELKVYDNFIKVVSLDLRISSKSSHDKKEFKVSIPFVIAPLVMYTNSESFIKNALGLNDDEKFSTRWLKYRSGEIGLWDLVFAGDLINDYKRNKIKNENDVAKLINKKNLTNLAGSALTLEGGFTAYTNIYILDKSDELLIEELLEEDLIDPDVWQDLALKLLAFDINFIDTEKENITNFITDMPTYSVLTFRDIKKKTKDNDDINEILKAMLANKPMF